MLGAANAAEQQQQPQPGSRDPFEPMRRGHRAVVEGVLRPAYNAAAPAREAIYGEPNPTMATPFDPLSKAHQDFIAMLRAMSQDYTTHNRLMGAIGQPQWRRQGDRFASSRTYGGGQARNPGLY